MDVTLYNLHEGSKDIFKIERSDYKREWMDGYGHSFAYRCLPLKIANEAGWVIRSPIDFELEYITDNDPLKSVRVEISENDKMYRSYITSHFGRGVVTFSLPYIFRTPKPWCVWARGYPNYYKKNISFLEGIIETYWLHSTFTYNIRLVEKNEIVKFSKGDPLLFLTLVNINELDHSTIINDSIDDNLPLKEAYQQWNKSRSEFNKNLTNPLDWQKDYFRGIRPDSNTEEQHLTTIKLNIKDKEK